MAFDESERDDLLDRLVEEFAARLRRGERPTLKEYSDRYPELADEIRELFPAMVEVEQAKEICHDWDADEAERANPGAAPCAGGRLSDRPRDRPRGQLDSNSPPSSSIMLQVEERTANETVGQTLFSDFSSSYNASTGVITFLATASFNMAADTGYWLVLSDPNPTKGVVTWEFTTSQVYQSSFGYGLPSFNTAYCSDQDNGMGNAMYYQPSDGPQLFQLLSVPEPSSSLLLGVPVAIAIFATCLRGARASRLRRRLAGQAAEAVPQCVT